MLMRGTTKRTRQQIQDEFDRLKARVNVCGGADQRRMRQVETTRENLPAVLRLVAEILREPSFPADEFEQLRQQRLAGLEQAKSEPQAHRPARAAAAPAAVSRRATSATSRRSRNRSPK